MADRPGSSPGPGDAEDPELDERELALLEEIEDASDAARGARSDLAGLHGRGYIGALPAAVPGMAPAAAVLGRLIDAVEDDPRWHFLTLRALPPRAAHGEVLRLRLGSDPGLGVPPADAVAALLRGAGAVVDLLVRRDAGPPPRCSVAVELSDGIRLRLLAAPAGAVPPGSVVLHGTDRAAPEAGTADRPAPGPAPGARPGSVPASSPAADFARARTWLFEGWWALGDVAAAIGASSFLEAGEALAEVRRAVCRLWAVGEGVPDAGAGLAGLLRVPAARTPKGLELLMPRPLPAELRTAALAAADLLHAAANHAGRRLGQVPRSGLEQAVRTRLSARR